MKQVLLIVFAVLVLPVICQNQHSLSAQSLTETPVVSVQEAQTIALNFFRVTVPGFNAHTQLTASLKYTKTVPGHTVAFYVFDIDPAPGFVIVAANKNVTPILAYSTERKFNTDFNHVGVSNWMYKTSENIYLALQQNAKADERIAGLWTVYEQEQKPSATKNNTVSPMVTTLWDQESLGNPPPYLYNLYCPYNNTDHQRCLTGCVATAQAQIMKFWNYPAQGTASFSYLDNVSNGYSYNYGNQSANFGITTYDWANMPVTMTDTTAGINDTAVAVLMYHCAVSVGMDFGDDNQSGSGAEAVQADAGAGQACSEYALPNYFSYNPATIRGVYESNYTQANWIALIEGELTGGRPVLYEGNDSIQGGHAWVCDGFDANDMFHMNWGWSGIDNGYFAVTNLTTSGNYNPIQDEEALIGIEPLSPATGVNTTTDFSFNVFPNPAKNDIVVQVEKTARETTLFLKNVLGQTLLSKNISDLNTRIDLSEFSSGFYLFELRQGDKSVSKKVIISK